jgi:hypothetical protein
MGYETYWLDNRDNIKDNFFDNSLVITEQWLVFQNNFSNKMPLNKSAEYLVHYIGNKGAVEGNPGINHYLGKVKKVVDFRFNSKYGWGINGVPDKNYSYKFEPEKYLKISEVSYYEKNSDFDRFYSIWATDLLPKEINFFDRMIKKENFAFFCGTIREDNSDVFKGFIEKCKINNVPFIYNNPWNKQMKVTDIRKYVRSSMYPIDIRPLNHISNGYIACRPIKNTSYGALPITNSKEVALFFNNECAYSEDTSELFDIVKELQNKKDTNDMILNHMREIQKNHTYINRIKDIISAMELR